MFGIGTGELLLLLLLALLVLGPERMPKMARDVGKVMSDLRRTSDELRDEFLNADRAIRGAINVEPVNVEPVKDVAAASEPTIALPEATPVPFESAFDRELREARERLRDRPTADTPAA